MNSVNAVEGNVPVKSDVVVQQSSTFEIFWVRTDGSQGHHYIGHGLNKAVSKADELVQAALVHRLIMTDKKKRDDYNKLVVNVLRQARAQYDAAHSNCYFVINDLSVMIVAVNNPISVSVSVSVSVSD